LEYFSTNELRCTFVVREVPSFVFTSVLCSPLFVGDEAHEEMIWARSHAHC